MDSGSIRGFDSFWEILLYLKRALILFFQLTKKTNIVQNSVRDYTKRNMSYVKISQFLSLGTFYLERERTENTFNLGKIILFEFFEKSCEPY